MLIIVHSKCIKRVNRCNKTKQLDAITQCSFIYFLYNSLPFSFYFFNYSMHRRINFHKNKHESFLFLLISGFYLYFVQKKIQNQNSDGGNVNTNCDFIIYFNFLCVINNIYLLLIHDLIQISIIYIHLIRFVSSYSAFHTIFQQIIVFF